MAKKRSYTGMYELLQAIEDAIEFSEPAKRDNLKQTFRSYMKDSPEEFFWAVGPQSPTLLHHLMHSIEPVSRPKQSKKSAGAK